MFRDPLQRRLVIAAVLCMAIGAAFIASVFVVFPIRTTEQTAERTLEVEVREGSAWSLAETLDHDSTPTLSLPDALDARLNGNAVRFEPSDRFMGSRNERSWEAFATAHMGEDGTLVVDASSLPESVVLMENHGVRPFLVAAPACLLLPASGLLFTIGFVLMCKSELRRLTAR